MTIIVISISERCSPAITLDQFNAEDISQAELSLPFWAVPNPSSCPFLDLVAVAVACHVTHKDNHMSLADTVLELVSHPSEAHLPTAQYLCHLSVCRVDE